MMGNCTTLIPKRSLNVAVPGIVNSLTAVGCAFTGLKNMGVVVHPLYSKSFTMKNSNA
jgi:hypothetical protein